MRRYHLDNRRLLLFPGKEEAFLKFAVDHWISSAQSAIRDHGYFAVALSGGSTPKKMFQKLAKEHSSSLPWEKVYLFWSDERNALPSDEESNFHMAMIEGNLLSLPLDQKKIFRMIAEKEMEANAGAYADKIREILHGPHFDLIMLGMGEDGHTASLFPKTEALGELQKWVVASYVPQKNSWRMTLTFPLINQAKAIFFYVTGSAKAEALEKVLFSPFDPLTYPAQNVGSSDHPATWIIDDAAAARIIEKIQTQGENV